VCHLNFVTSFYEKAVDFLYLEREVNDVYLYAALSTKVAELPRTLMYMCVLTMYDT